MKHIRAIIAVLAFLLIMVFFSGCGVSSSADIEKAYRQGYQEGLANSLLSTYTEAYWNGFDVGFTQSYCEFYGNNNDEDYIGLSEDIEEWLDEGIGDHLSYIVNEQTPDIIVQGAKDGFLDGFELGWETWKEGKIIRSWSKGVRFQEK